jgi:hypothetical protein
MLNTETRKGTPKSNRKRRSGKVASQKKGETLHQYDHSKIQDMIYDMEKKFHRNFLNDVEVV